MNSRFIPMQKYWRRRQLRQADDPGAVPPGFPDELGRPRDVLLDIGREVHLHEGAFHLHRVLRLPVSGLCCGVDASARSAAVQVDRLQQVRDVRVDVELGDAQVGELPQLRLALLLRAVTQKRSTIASGTYLLWSAPGWPCWR